MNKFKDKTKLFLSNHSDKIKLIIVAIFIALFGMFPYLNDIVPFSHDLGYHLNRINEIANGLNIKKIPVLIHAGLIENLGYGNGLFYPQLFIYIPAILVSKFGLLVIPAYKVFLVLITFFTFMTMYISVKGIFKNKYIAWISSLLYVFSLYRLTDIYVRGAVGELLAFVFNPLILYGFYNVIFDDGKKWWVIVIGISGLVYSHLLSVLIMAIFFIMICLLNVDKIFKNKKVFLNLLKAAIITAFITIGYFGPMIEQKCDDVFNVDGRSIYSCEEVQGFASSLGMAFSSKMHGGFATNSGIDEKTMPEGAGIILLIMTGLFVFRKGITFKENRFEIEIFGLGILFYFATTKLFIWNWFSLLNVIQFPFRFNLVATLCFSLIGAKSFYELLSEDKRKDFVLIFTIFYLVYAGYTLDSVELDFTGWNGNYDVLTSTFDRQVGTAEYLPDGTYIYDLDLYNIHNKDVKLEYNQVGSTITFEYTDTENPLEINMPLVYYKGYNAYIVDKEGNKKDLIAEKYIVNAHVLVKSDEKLTGTITVEYKLTLVQKISYVIATSSFILFVIYIGFYEYKNRVYVKSIKEK